MKRIISIILLSLTAQAFTGLSAAKIDFEKEVWPILGGKCISCHGAPYMKRGKKRTAKSDLRLDSPARIQKGSEDNKDIIVPGDADKSLFVKLIILDEDHDDVMPSKGDLLTAVQIKLIKDWINAGVDYGDWKGLPEEYNYEKLKKENGWGKE